MTDFKFRTRGQSNPQGKSRVYFTCHPQDFEQYFDTICGEILERQNCAVFYLEPDTKPENVEDYELRLREMQLFVVPVTTKLLTTRNHTMDSDVPFAVDNHIPVLPLMQESGLEELFNRKFGDMQFLDKTNTDSTAISYEEKLTKYLNSVIVGDELAEKIRAAFDAYIFLSYRKKDRKYAQKLMELIHSNPFCRDIAIWYDEFLTPGENFNEAIRAALEKSELFALAVTPNLVNEINYILNIEYPMACKLGKKILPAEMQPTDKEKLRKLYEGIPEIIDSGDAEAMGTALSLLFERFAIRENDTDPQHKFFIGLAYLSGIDVEVNHERALELITGSAETGYIPAIEKLVSMYNKGEGVKRDYLKAIEWQKKLVETIKKNYNSSPDEGTAKDLISALWDLEKFCYDLSMLKEAKDAAEELSEYAKTFYSVYGSRRFYRNESVSYNKLGNIANAEGNLSQAEMYYKKALEICIALADETNTVEARRDLSISYIMLGSIAQVEGNLSQAKIYYEKAFEIDKELAAETSTVEARLDLSISYKSLGNIALAEFNYSQAKSYYEKALEIQKTIAEETDTVEAHSVLASSYNTMGFIIQNEGNIIQAKMYYEKALEIAKALADKTNTVKARCDLANNYDNLGNIAKSEGNLNKAKMYYKLAMEIRKALSKETNTVEDRRNLAFSYNNLGLIAQIEDDRILSKLYYKLAIEIRKVLVKETGSNISYYELADSYFRLGSLLKSRSYLEEALSITITLYNKTGQLFYKKNIEIITKFINDNYSGES